MLHEFCVGRVAVFIDAANIFYSQRTLGWSIDYEKLVSYLRSETNLIDISYYTGKVGTFEKQLLFVKKLERIGYRVVAKEVKFIRSGQDILQKGSLDVELALDAFRLKDEFDTFVLLSGDSDFAYLLDLLKNDGKRVIVISMRGHISRELIERAKFVPLPKIRRMIEKVKGPDKPTLDV